MERLRIYKVSKMFGITGTELCALLQKNGILKNNFSSVTEQELEDIYQALLKVNIKKAQGVSDRKLNVLEKKIRDIKYHDTIKFLVHMITEKTERKKVLSQIAYINPHLASRILITICDDIRKEKEYLLKIVEDVYSEANNRFVKFLAIISLLELEENQKINDIFNNEDDLSGFINVYKHIKNSSFFIMNISEYTHLSLIYYFLNYQRFDGIKATIKFLENNYIHEVEQNNNVLNITKSLNNQGYVSLACRLLNYAKLKKELHNILIRVNIEEFCGANVPFDSIADYLSMKYNLTEFTQNKISTWDSFLKNEKAENFSPYFKSKLLNFIKGKKISQEIRTKIAVDLQVDDNLLQHKNNKYSIIDTFDSKQINWLYEGYSFSLMINENNISNKQNMLYKPFRKYLFSNKKVTHNKLLNEKACNVLNICVNGYSKPENLIFLYFNSPLKINVYFEFLVNKLKQKFHLKNKKIRFLLKDYIFRGTVSDIKDSYITITPEEFLTEQKCRIVMPYQKSISDKKANSALERGMSCYFTFDYVKEIENKIIIYVQLAKNY